MQNFGCYLIQMINNLIAICALNKLQHWILLEILDIGPNTTFIIENSKTFSPWYNVHV